MASPDINPQAAYAAHQRRIKEIEKDLPPGVQLEVVNQSGSESLHIYDLVSGKSLTTFDSKVIMQQGRFSTDNLNQIKQRKDQVLLNHELESGSDPSMIMNPANIQAQKVARLNKMKEELQNQLPAGTSLRALDNKQFELYQVYDNKSRKPLLEFSGGKFNAQKGLTGGDLQKINDEKIALSQGFNAVILPAHRQNSAAAATFLSESLGRDRAASARASQAMREKDKKDAETLEKSKQAAKEEQKQREADSRSDEGLSVTPKIYGNQIR